MYQFKQLQWFPHEELDGIYAEPNGLKWSYSIIKNKNGVIAFSVFDSNYEYAPGFPQNCIKVEEAQEQATKHYLALLEQFITS